MDGGYDIGYRACPCFWGKEPGSLVRKLAGLVGSFHGLRVLDVGCGEGKNAAFLASHGAQVLAIDVSQIAIEHARTLWSTNHSVVWRVQDVRTIDLGKLEFDIVIAYGLCHCLGEQAEVENVVRALQRCTRRGGYNILVALNGRNRDLRAHPELKPCWLPHEWYVSEYSGWDLLDCSDSDLTEVHPHNKIWHTHSLTRILGRRGE